MMKHVSKVLAVVARAKNAFKLVGILAETLEFFEMRYKETFKEVEPEKPLRVARQ